MKILKWVAIIFIGLIVIGLIFGKEETAQTAIETPTIPVAAEPVHAEVAAEPLQAEQVAAKPVEPELTAPQSNAVRSAKQYLSIAGFSRDGLINQLSSSAGDGYSKDDATVAVDSLGVDWNEEAVRSAKQYLEISGFSCNGLIEQLSSQAGDQYTVGQATYGAKHAGAC